MKILPFIFILLITIIFFSCEKNDEILTTPNYPFFLPKAGVYIYSGYDSLGTYIVQGKIRFYYSDSSTIRGSWALTAIGNPSSIGPQIGSDTLWGHYSNSQYTLELNPQVVDNNVSISLFNKIDSQTYTGKWVWITESGYTNYGKAQFVTDSIY